MSIGIFRTCCRRVFCGISATAKDRRANWAKGRRPCPARSCVNGNFNPRPPRGGRLLSVHLVDVLLVISIHAPREGGRPNRLLSSFPCRHFNPRPPRGGRQGLVEAYAGIKIFQSTPPARGATHTYTSRPQTANHFNPHPPRGGRLSRCTAAPTGGYFNPRPPRGGRQYYLCQACHTRSISIHAPREGGDGDQGRRRCAVLNFNPRPPRGGRR